MQDINSILFPIAASEKHPHTKEVIKIAESMGITQKEMAELIGCKQPYVNQLKQGKGLAKIADLEPLVFRISPKLPGEEFYQYTVFKHKTYALPENWEKRVIVHAYNKHNHKDNWPNFDDHDDGYHDTDKYDKAFKKIQDKHLSCLVESTDYIDQEINDVNRLIEDLSTVLEAHKRKESVGSDENTTLVNKAKLLDVYKILMIKYLNTRILPFIEKEFISDESFSKNLLNIDSHIEETLVHLSDCKEELKIKIINIKKTNEERIDQCKMNGFFDEKALENFILNKITKPDQKLNLKELSEKLFSDAKYEVNDRYQVISFDMALAFLDWAKIKGNISSKITTEIIQLCGKSLWLYESEHRREINEWDDGDDPDREYGLDRFGNDEVYIKTDIYLRILESNSSRLYIIERDSGISYYTTINGPYTSLEILDVIRNRYSDKFNLNIDEIESKLVKEGYPLPGIRYIY